MSEEKTVEENVEKAVEKEEATEESTKKEEAMEESNNLLEKEDSSEETDIERLREDLRKRQEKKLQKMKKTNNRNDAKRCKISGIIAAIAGVLEIIYGLTGKDYMQICIGITFMCVGYFFYNMGISAEKEKKKQGK